MTDQASSRTKQAKLKLFISICMFLDVLYGCETSSVRLREEQRLRVFENRLLRRIFGPKRTRPQGSGEDYITKNLMTCIHHKILFG
jgi:hypothetical protein